MPHVAEYGGRRGEDGEHGAARRDLPRAHQRFSRGALALALCGKLAFGLVARFALQPQIAAGLHDAAQDVVRQLDAPHVEPLLDAEQAPVDEHRERIGRGTRCGETLLHALLGQALAVAGLGQQIVLDELPHARRLVGQRALVELAENIVAGAG
jgi:hypothetical protein